MEPLYENKYKLSVQVKQESEDQTVIELSLDDKPWQHIQMYTPSASRIDRINELLRYFGLPPVEEEDELARPD